MRSLFGGGVRDGAGVALVCGRGDGDDVVSTCVVVTCAAGATQSIGCTTAAPVVGSYSMTRTPDAVAQSSRPFASAPPSVTR